mmetsp:Transcript_3263/g.4583  ORF Transcript_3263/g.4583 Transcript_3263/m.4583 type:complete len:387 (-) Transcript_3263:56-1216(-)
MKMSLPRKKKLRPYLEQSVSLCSVYAHQIHVSLLVTMDTENILLIWTNTLRQPSTTPKNSKKRCAKCAMKTVSTMDTRTKVTKLNKTMVNVALTSVEPHLIVPAVLILVRRLRTWKKTVMLMLLNLLTVLKLGMKVMMVALFSLVQCVLEVVRRSRLVYSVMRNVCSLRRILMLKITLPTVMEDRSNFLMHFSEPPTRKHAFLVLLSMKKRNNKIITMTKNLRSLKFASNCMKHQPSVKRNMDLIMDTLIMQHTLTNLPMRKLCVTTLMQLKKVHMSKVEKLLFLEQHLTVMERPLPEDRSSSLHSSSLELLGLLFTQQCYTQALPRVRRLIFLRKEELWPKIFPFGQMYPTTEKSHHAHEMNFAKTNSLSFHYLSHLCIVFKTPS